MNENGQVIPLNTEWRVVAKQENYLLQQREGEEWVTRAMGGYRNQLLRRIGDYCGEVDQDSLKRIQTLPWRPEIDNDGE
jgi:hypothetical protein